jgi:lysophospholipid acyltransferase (LPLAT)-like uncharacterized protein
VKAILRSGPVQALLALILGGYLWLVMRTIRWRIVNRPPADALLADPQGFIVCFWHGRIAASIGAQPLCRPRRATRAIISLSEDGGFVAGALALMDLPAFRGSSRKTRDPKRRHSGGQVYRQSLAWVREGGVLLITPDGPRGPNEQMAEGPVRMASRTAAPVILMGLATSPALRLKTWDRMQLPAPFGRGVIAFDGPLHAPEGLAGEAMNALRRDWSARLTAANAAAEAALK